MTDFNRYGFIPHSPTMPIFPEGLDSWGLSGKGQFRETMNVGRTWEETYGLLRETDANFHAFWMQINKFWRERTIFELTHLSKTKPLNDPITGAIEINGDSQTGSTLTVTSTLNKILKAGDIVKIANVNLVYDVAADMASPTATSLVISPPIYTGGSPANGAAITITGVKFRCVISEKPTPPRFEGRGVYSGLGLKFRECP